MPNKSVIIDNPIKGNFALSISVFELKKNSIIQKTMVNVKKKKLSIFNFLLDKFIQGFLHWY